MGGKISQYLAILGLLACGLLADSFSVEVPPGQRECYLLAVEKGDIVEGNFELLVEAPLSPVQVTLSEIQKDGVGFSGYRMEFSDREEAVFKVEAERDGLFELCLGNGYSGDNDGTSRTYGFAFRLGALDDDDILVDLGSIEDEQRLDQLQGLLGSAEAFMGDLKNLMDHQAYMRQREEIHRSITESTNSRVMWWTLVEAVVLVTLAVWQVTYIRQFFEVKRAL